MIKIYLNNDEINKSKEFAINVVGETYNRFNQSENERAKRIFYGKLGEIVFLKFLNSKSILEDTKDMFKIFKGETNVDNFDFNTKDNKTIDIKTAYEENHIRILIPYDQFENNKAKNYYVGIKISKDLSSGTIYGFITKESIIKNGKKDFGEGLAYWEYLDKLENIDNLIKLI